MSCCSASTISALEGGATVNVRGRNIPVQFFRAGGFGTGDDPSECINIFTIIYQKGLQFMLVEKFFYSI